MPSHRAPEPDPPDPGPVAPQTTEIPRLDLPPPPFQQENPAIPAAADDHLSGGQEPVDTAEPIDWTSRRKPGKSERRPEPVLNAAKIAGALAGVILAIGGVLRLVGIIDIGDSDLQRVADAASNAVLAVGVLWATVGPWVLAKWRARPRVTPLADPRDERGRRLVPEGR